MRKCIICKRDSTSIFCKLCWTAQGDSSKQRIVTIPVPKQQVPAPATPIYEIWSMCRQHKKYRGKTEQALCKRFVPFLYVQTQVSYDLCSLIHAVCEVIPPVYSIKTREPHHKPKESPELTIWKRARVRAKNKNLPFNIHIEDIVIPQVCPVLGIPLEVSSTGKPTRRSPSIDRIIPALGYVKGNIRIVSMRANTLRGSRTTADLEQLKSEIEALLKDSKSLDEQTNNRTIVFANLTNNSQGPTEPALYAHQKELS